jgi:hypothetical protein
LIVNILAAEAVITAQYFKIFTDHSNQLVKSPEICPFDNIFVPIAAIDIAITDKIVVENINTNPINGININKLTALLKVTCITDLVQLC